MPNSTQTPEARPKAPSNNNNKDDVPATSTSPKASPAHEWATDTSQMQVINANLLENPFTPPLSAIPPRPIKTVECNMMRYIDGEGVTRQIYMPKGTARLAGDLFTARRFSGLAKFPAWDNQTYDDWEADGEKYAYLNEELGEPAP